LLIEIVYGNVCCSTQIHRECVTGKIHATWFKCMYPFLFLTNNIYYRDRNRRYTYANRTQYKNFIRSHVTLKCLEHVITRIIISIQTRQDKTRQHTHTYNDHYKREKDLLFRGPLLNYRLVIFYSYYPFQDVIVFA